MLVHPHEALHQTRSRKTNLNPVVPLISGFGGFHFYGRPLHPFVFRKTPLKLGYPLRKPPVLLYHLPQHPFQLLHLRIGGQDPTTQKQKQDSQYQTTDFPHDFPPVLTPFCVLLL
ncbi:hypothetical protein TDIS_2003 [Thermosulfurimonas dismutans]|uniref:Uncharacterized protein n=1 Tax=Thermosulfurimonas dismutans TaxID=999894 RepID=A0A179D295_9BACT|nr:hypothetical protein TDIS_2003 [Thermosulfurimonas dismutans]